MSSKNLGLSLSLVAGMYLLPSPAQAESLVLQVAQSLDAYEASCPKQVTVNEESEPYEGGFKVNGQAQLRAIASSFSIVDQDDFSVTWAATLKPQYSQCKATAGLGDERGISYLRMRFVDGKVFLILDMTGLRDANGFTTEILSQSVENGNPVWQWGGTD
ncbi:MAG TPA: hypothetical protein V6D33_04320 [Cyanophyceae cyanobacterium]